jgi:hypothetical protein
MRGAGNKGIHYTEFDAAAAASADGDEYRKFCHFHCKQVAKLFAAHEE